ncbi:MAG: 4-hydroxy-3-methylbut-2-enyl diphosphate reductase [Crocinitomicaceae bacterium]|nr:4-hydroxy-3-methylbut-2-enyl diphosphate reductase [Crocinitomicaceae bacterium]
MRSFDIPLHFRSPIISRVKARRKELDRRKVDFTPTTLDFGTVKIQLARHFGFCFGVENAIEISYKAIAENPDKRIFLLSQMIHNPEVNEDLESRGVQFLQDTIGNEITPISEIGPEDVVIIPAFGATLEIQEELEKRGVDVQKYNTTCPFVEKVWKRSSKLGSEDYTVVIHGKPDHEETRATFSHAASTGKAMIITDISEAETLAGLIERRKRGESIAKDFNANFAGRTSDAFDADKDFEKVGVVNQTTMIAAETTEIAEIIKRAVGDEGSANTRDTLCYATNDNQRATYGALEDAEADLALVVGGYNSSNTTHIVELCEKKMPTYFVRNELEWDENGYVNHFNIHTEQMEQSSDFLPQNATILITSGASCPDASLERVLLKVLAHYSGRDVEDVLKTWEESNMP